MPQILHTKNIGSITAYGDALTGGYDGTKAQFYALVAGIADGAMLLDIGSRDIVLSASLWNDGEYDLTSLFPINRYMLLSVGIDGDEASGTEINAWYNAEVFLKDGNILFAHGTRPDEDIHVAVTYQSMIATIAAVPVMTGEFTYNGTEQVATWDGYDSTSMTMSGDIKGTDAGTYTTYFTPNQGYKWWDDTKEAKAVTWSIAKNVETIALSAYQVDLLNEGDTATVTINQELNGLRVFSDSDLVEVLLSGSTITITRKGTAKGNASIIVQTDEYRNTTYTATIAAICGVTIYGAQWAGAASPVWTRTDDAVDFEEPVAAISDGDGSSPFDNIMPWAGMQIVEDEKAGTLVSIPKFYYKWTRNGNAMKLQISMAKFDGSFVSPAHADRGDGNGERDIVYVGRYLCADNFKSETEVSALSALRSTFRSSIHQLGNDLWHNDYAMYWTIRMLFLVEYATWNAYSVFGINSYHKNGATDIMKYHTGTSAADKTTAGATQYRNIEINGSAEQYDGIYFNSRSVYCIKNPANFADSSGGTLVGSQVNTNSYITKYSVPTANGFEWALVPSAASGGSQTTYICARQYYNSSNRYLYSEPITYGMFEWAGGTLTYKFASRLMKLPNA